MRRSLKITLWSLGGVALLLFIAIGAMLIVGNTDAGRRAVERLTQALSGGYVTLSGLQGRFPSHLTLDHLTLTDTRGVWLTADTITLDWSPWLYLTRGLSIDNLHAAKVSMQRLPQGSSKPSKGEPSMPRIEVARFAADSVELGAELAGASATLTLKGSARMRSVSDMLFEVDAHRSDGEGEYSLHLHFDPKRMDASLQLHEPANGPLENILSLPGLGELTATATFAGLRSDEKLDLTLQAGGLSGRAQGQLNLTDLSANLHFDFDAPGMQPRADLRWSRLSLHGVWRGSLKALNADAQLEATEIDIPGGVKLAKVSAAFKAEQGAATLRAVIDGLKIPGKTPGLFADSSVKADASLRMDQTAWPFELNASHRLFVLQARGNAAAPQSADADVKLLQLAPFAALVGEDLGGNATVKAHLSRAGSALRITASAVTQLNLQGQAWAGLVGEHPAADVLGTVSNDSIDIETFKLSGRAVTLTANGSYALAQPALRARFDLNISELKTIADALAGTARATGTLQGPIGALTAEVDAATTLSVRGSPSGDIKAQLNLQGLPSAPSGSLAAQGMLDGSPLHAQVDAQRTAAGALHTLLRTMDWKSAHAEGEFTTSTAHQTSKGQLRAGIAQLGDLEHLLGTALAGSLEATLDVSPDHERTRLHADVKATDLTLATLSGSLHLSGEGFTDAFPFQLDAELPKLRGAAASLNAAATLNLDGRELLLSRALAHYHGQEIDLKSPARVMFANGIAVDDLKLGSQQAELELRGPIWPDAALRVSLRKVQPELVNAFFPDLLAAGSIEAHAELHGDLRRPVGQAELNATGLRSADDVALGVPPANLHAEANLKGNTADLDVRLNAGADSQLNVTGRVPLAFDGAVDAKVIGKVSMGIINPLLEARGQHADGTLEIDASVRGSVADPQIGGTAHLSQANLRDYGRGVSITNIDAQLEGAAGTIQIKSLTAMAAPGTLKASGSVGVLQPKMPIDIRILANDAQPIVSKLITANLDADLHISGSLREQVSVDGKLLLNRTLIGIPNSLPPNVAVLDVRRRGKSAPPPPDKPLIIALNVAVQAPRQILVQGRGLDAEMGGELHIGGTSDSPLVSGDFGLLRGNFSIAGNKLTFTSDSNISFNGTGLQNRLDPTLDFTATSTVNSSSGDASVSLRITGLADAPQFEFTSVPTLPQDEIMALLLFGTPANALSPLQLAQVGVALASLSGVGGDSNLNPLVKIQKSLGLDRLNIGAGTSTATGTGTAENTGASIQAGRYISKRVYIEGKQSTTGTSQLEADIDLTKRLKLQTKLGNGTASVQGTTADNDPGSSVGLIYQFEY
jgi:translocation and assembly module TamB